LHLLNDGNEFNFMGFKLKGMVDAVARDKHTGEIEWEVHQPNLITDYGRRAFVNNAIGGSHVFTSPFVGTPAIDRYAIADSGNSSASQSAFIAYTYSTLTLTRTYTASFNPPASNRTVGTIGLGEYSSSIGSYQIVAMSPLSPAKVQSTTQILEISYRLVLVPAS